MILLTYRTPSGLTLGAKTEKGIFALGRDLDAFFKEGSAALPALQAYLEAGDVISTGTPKGVLGRADRVRLKPGDVVAAKVGHLGRLTNPVVAER